jgi:hypothetical protein
MGGVLMHKLRLKPSNLCSGSNNKWKTDKLSRHPHTLSAQKHLFILEWPMEKEVSSHLLHVTIVFTAFTSLVL